MSSSQIGGVFTSQAAILTVSTAEEKYYYRWPAPDGSSREISPGYDEIWHGYGDDGIDFLTSWSGTNEPDTRVVAMTSGVIYEICTNSSLGSSVIKIRHDDGKEVDYRHLRSESIPEWIKQSYDDPADLKRVKVIPGTVLGTAKPDTWSDDSCVQFTGQTSTTSHLHIDVPTKEITIEGWELSHTASNDCFTKKNIDGTDSTLCKKSTITSDTLAIDCDANIPYIGSDFCMRRPVVLVRDTQAEFFSEPIGQPNSQSYGFAQARAIGIVSEGPLEINNVIWWRVFFNQGSFSSVRPEHAETVQANNAYWVRESDLKEYGASPFIDIQLGQTFYHDMVSMKALGVYRGYNPGSAWNKDYNGSYSQDNQTVGQSVLVAFRILHDGNDPSQVDGINPSNSLTVVQSGNNTNISTSARWLYDEDMLTDLTYDCAEGVCLNTDRDISRAETATLAMNMLNANHEGEWTEGDECPAFPDLPSDHSHFDNIMDACDLGILHGYSDGNFKPDQPVTRGEWAKILVRSFFIMADIDTFPDSEVENTTRNRAGSSPAFTASNELVLAREGIFGQPSVPPSVSCEVLGFLIADETWSPTSCNPYIVTGSVIVPEGVTLTVAPGTRVQFTDKKSITVQGTLNAVGVAGNPVVFTSNSTSPAAGDWGYLHFAPFSHGSIQHAVVEYGGGATNIDGYS